MVTFQVDAVDSGEGAQINVRASDGEAGTYAIAGGEQQHYTDLYAALARDFGTRMPHFAGSVDDPPREPPATRCTSSAA